MTAARFRVQGTDGPWEVTLKGREEWAIAGLMAAGDAGLTTLSNPAPRWSHYIWKLRGYGIDIATITEAHDGPYAGHHARYVLKSKIERVSVPPAPNPSRAEECAHV
jgi:hypothetical protein